MKTGLAVSALVVAVSMTSCSLSRDQAKAKSLASGNRYYALGMYKEALSMYVKAIQADRKFGEAYYRAGLAATELQNWKESARYLRIAVDLQPENEDAYARLGNVYCFTYNLNKSLQTGLLVELKSLSARMHERFPGTYDDERIKAYVALFSNDLEGALLSLDRANRVRPNQEEVILAWVKTLLKMGRVNEANDLAEKALAANPGALKIYDVLIAHYLRSDHPGDVERIVRLKVWNNPKVADGYLEAAAQSFAAGNPAEMKAALQPIIERSADFPNGPHLLGDFYLRVRDWDSAAEHYRRGLNFGSKSRPTYQKRLIEVLAKQNKHREALQLIQDVVKENPTDPEAIAIRASLAVIAEDKARIPAAIKDFQEVIGQLPEDFVLLYTYGRALMLSGDLARAIPHFKEALRLRPDYIWPRITLAFITLDVGDYSSTLVLSREILAEEGANIPFDTAGQRPQERPLYDEILKIKPDTHMVLNKLADALAAKRVAPDEALAMSRRAGNSRPVKP